ncbi:carbohydrate ABC transporter permease [Alicyclobacillus fodiniaquatilis]|uniref:Carbohydrate ABC transporter permease n=1 Tax=Alicyclobacillus fodiniaquatilis TaxID=1661150 RepID=A0ABW4JIB9_9BACL
MMVQHTVSEHVHMQKKSRVTPGAVVAKVIVYIILIVGAVLMIAPLLWMIATALSNDQYAMSFPPKFFPSSFHFGNFLRIFTHNDFGLYLRNTLVITIPAIVGQVLASSLAAFAFARLRAPGKNILFIILLCTLMIPGEVTMIPNFIIFRYFHWLNTFWPLIVPNFFGNAFNIFLMRQFFMSVPLELDEAAKLDGLGYLGVWWRIIIPLCKPALVTVAVFTFTANWGNFMGPLIYINNQKLFPLALGIYQMTQTSNVMEQPNWNLIMAGALVLTIPMIIVFFYGQRHIYEGSNILGRQ